MARISRQTILISNGYYHVMARGNNKKQIFVDDNDFNQWKLFINKYKSKYNTKIVAYCLMPNHYHLLLKSGPELPRLIGVLNTQYAKYFNNKYTKKNHLFGDRYKSFLISEEPYLINLIRYIHNNPIRANLVNDAAIYKHSSLQDYLTGNGITDANIIYELIERVFLGTPISKILS